MNFESLDIVSLVIHAEDFASLRSSFSDVYQQHVQQNGSFPSELLYLYTAWQVLDRTVMNLTHSVLAYSFMHQYGRRDVIEE